MGETHLFRIAVRSTAVDKSVDDRRLYWALAPSAMAPESASFDLFLT